MQYLCTFHDYMSAAEFAKRQIELSKNIVDYDILEYEKLNLICGIDVSYRQNIAYCSAVIIKKDTLEPVEVADTRTHIEYPYIPGLFGLRESKPILVTIESFKERFDILLVDGHGVLHP